MTNTNKTFNNYQNNKSKQHLKEYKNPILNYFKTTYNDSFYVTFMNNKTNATKRIKHSGAHLLVTSFDSEFNGFRRYNQPDYYYITTSTVDIMGKCFFSLRKETVLNADSNMKYMFLMKNYMLVLNRDDIIKNRYEGFEGNIINKDCFYIDAENEKCIENNWDNYFGFYNKDQWRPEAIGFVTYKYAANRFMLGNDKYVFNGASEVWRMLEEGKIKATFNGSLRTLQRQIKKGTIHFEEGDVEVKMVKSKFEKVNTYTKTEISQDEKDYIEWEKSVFSDVTPDNSMTQNVSNVIIKSNNILYNKYNNIYNNNNNIFNNNIGHADGDVPRVVNDKNKENEIDTK